MKNNLYLDTPVCIVEQVAEKTTECDRHADVVIIGTWFCDVVRVKVDVHELFAIVGDGPVKPFNHTKAQENTKEYSIITKSHVESCLLVYCLLTTATVCSQLERGQDRKEREIPSMYTITSNNRDDATNTFCCQELSHTHCPRI